MTSSKTDDAKHHPAPDKEKAPAGGKSEAPAPEKALAVADPAEQVAAAKKEAAANHERYVRAVADLENFRRRTVREKEELRLFAATRLLEDLLPALDNLALGLAAAKQPNADLKALAGGVELVQQQLKGALAAHGLKEINPLGEAFDPRSHEALGSVERPDLPDQHVAEEIRRGYRLRDRLLRPSLVRVVSNSKQTAE